MTSSPASGALDRLGALLARLGPEARGEADEALGALRAEVEAATAQQRALAESQAEALVNAAMMMSELEQTHAELDRARRAAEAAAVAKSSFLATMSHEIRTPMNGVMGMLQLVLASPLEPGQRARLATAYRSAEALLALLNEILEFSKLEAGRCELEHRPFSLASLVEDVGALFEQLCVERGLELRLEVDPLLAPEHLADAHRVRQVLTNLVGNAVKFTARGHVELRVAVEATSASAQAIAIAVGDSGIGIPRERLSQLFQPFTQVDGSTARRYGGTGLGLAICRQLAELMGGRIEVASELGRGSTFTLHLRLNVADRTETGDPRLEVDERRRAPTPRPGPRALLLVEDNPVNREVAVAMLEEWALSVDCAEDGDEALRRGADRNYDLVLMDCQMPGRDGLETTREWRRREVAKGGRRTPIVALTANAMPGDRERCLSAGMDDYLPKPFTREMLGEKLARWLDADAPARGSG